jgi:hypothetical protein
MTHPNILPSHRAAIVGAIDPDAYAASAVSSGWIKAADFHDYMAAVMVGTMATNSTVDAKLQQATDGSGTGVKDITGKAITQLTEAGTDSDKQAIINLRQEELDINNGFTHFRLTVTVAVAASDAGAVVLGMEPRYGPASDNDAASVDEIVA